MLRPCYANVLAIGLLLGESSEFKDFIDEIFNSCDTTKVAKY